MKSKNLSSAAVMNGTLRVEYGITNSWLFQERQSLCQNHISVSSNSSVFIFMQSDLKKYGKITSGTYKKNLHNLI